MCDEKYFITFVDDNTRYFYVYLIKNKYGAIDKYTLYKQEIKNQLINMIKVPRSNRGGEYDSLFQELCVQREIIHEFTTPYSSQSNRIVEWKN